MGRKAPDTSYGINLTDPEYYGGSMPHVSQPRDEMRNNGGNPKTVYAPEITVEGKQPSIRRITETEDSEAVRGELASKKEKQKVAVDAIRSMPHAERSKVRMGGIPSDLSPDSPQKSAYQKLLADRHGANPLVKDTYQYGTHIAGDDNEKIAEATTHWGAQGAPYGTAARQAKLDVVQTRDADLLTNPNFVPPKKKK